MRRSVLNSSIMASIGTSRVKIECVRHGGAGAGRLVVAAITRTPHGSITLDELLDYLPILDSAIIRGKRNWTGPFCLGATRVDGFVGVEARDACDASN